ncbi:MAG: CPBP family intramembrane metalloprotease [Deltaproteobacteria bacterium]|nr:CPBP family intramembrane metalloprotease [Deltaproteobacteria bacterium]
MEKLGKSKIYFAALILMAGPFYLNDFANIYVKSWQWWLFIDYAVVKLFPVLVMLWLIRSKAMQASEFGLSIQPVLPFFTVFSALTVVGTLIDQNAYQLMAKLPGNSPLGGMPDITSPFWNWIDLTLGLAMVAIVEEIVFRGYLHTFLGRFTQNPVAIVMLSSALFGLIHWSLGLHAIVITASIGAIFMIAYIKTRSLPAIMLAHFAVNFIDYAGVIPKSIFKFL